MPFITKDRRIFIDNGGNPKNEGELCYIYYKQMVKEWKENPRWVTCHKILYNSINKILNINSINDITAIILAFLVFFNLYVMPYEIKKREENGDI